MFFYIR